ncbi:hypothetical protein HII36_34890 [Nonomuraea sp. NN258]|uniref:hypothetical protein n=1 Tax=Nonomuraea antri TaxID=2730852 RepID=UPI001568298C|nr:hypothetical protein [Nonomuraea antri]NRQ36988.1 hypothetical protein [Nonomuraea antri]
MRFFTREWAEAARAAADAGPSPEARAAKLDGYWRWIERARSGYTATWALDVRESGSYLLLTWKDGRCVDATIVAAAGTAAGPADAGVAAGSADAVASTDAAAAVASAAVAASADYVLSATEATWHALLAGADPGKAVMYRDLRLEHGDVLLFFRVIYFFIESLAAVARVPTK